MPSLSGPQPPISQDWPSASGPVPSQSVRSLASMQSIFHAPQSDPQASLNSSLSSHSISRSAHFSPLAPQASLKMPSSASEASAAAQVVGQPGFWLAHISITHYLNA